MADDGSIYGIEQDINSIHGWGRAGFTDSELLTVSIVAELVGLDAETRCLAYLRRNHHGLFPRLSERSRYNRRRRQLAEATNRIRGR